MPNVVFNAETGTFVSNVDGLTKSVQKSADAVVNAKNTILSSYKMQVQAAKEVGASASELEAIQRRSAQMMANVTETNANRMISSLDRISTKQKAVAASLAALNSVSAATPLKEAGDGAEYMASRFQRSQAAMQAMRGNFTRNSRAAEAFLSTIGPLNGLIEKAFPIIGAVTFGMVILQGVEALKKMYDKAKQVPYAIAEGFASINEPLRANANALQQDNDALQATIDKLEHKPGDGLALALDDVLKRTDALTKSAHTASDAIAKLLTDQKVGVFGELLGNGSTGDISKELKSRYSGITSAQNEDEKQFDYADTMARTITDPKARENAEKDAQAAQAKRQAAIDKQLASLQNYIRSTRAKINGNVKQYDTGGGYVGTVSYADAYGKQTANNNLLNGAEDVADSMQLQRTREATNVRLTGQAKGLESDKILGTAAAEAARKAFEKLKAQWQTEDDDRKLAGKDSATIETNTWTQRAAAAKVGSQAYLFARQQAAEALKQVTSQFTEQQHKDAETAQKSQRNGWDLSFNSFIGEKPRTAQQTGDFWGMRALEATPGSDNERAALDKMSAAYRDAAKAAEEADKARTKAAEDAVKNAAAYAQAAVAIQLQTGQISKYDAAQQLANIHAQQYASQMSELRKSLASAQAVDPNSAASINAQAAIAKANADREVEIQKDAADTAAASWQGSLTNAFDLWYQHAKDTSAQVTGLFTEGLNGANQNLVNAMTGDYKRGDIKKYGHTMLKSASSDLLQHGEASIFKGLGLTPKADGSKNNPFYVIDAQGNVVPTAASGLSKLVGGSDSSGGGSGSSGSHTGGIFGSIESLFHVPHTPNGTGFDSGSSNAATYGVKPKWYQAVLSYAEQALGIAGAARGGSSTSTDASDIGGYSAGGSMSGRDQDYGGGYALGGGVKQSGVYDVGEMGREKVYLPQGSYVQPHNQQSGGNTYYSVSVADGVTPEQMNTHVRAALQEYHPHVVRASVAAVSDAKRRVPKQ